MHTTRSTNLDATAISFLDEPLILKFRAECQFLVGGVDVEGNAYGADYDFFETDSFDFGCDKSFIDDSMSDSFVCEMDDW